MPIPDAHIYFSFAIHHGMKRTAVLMSIGSLVIMFALIVDPVRYTQSIKNGLDLFVVAVLPSMLPFFFLSGLLTATGLARVIASKWGKFVVKLYGAPPVGLYVMLMSCLSGYPVGAKLTAELYENGLLSETGAKRILPFTSATGPMFVIGAVGAGLLGDVNAGLCIAASHYLATVLNGLLYRKKSSVPSAPLPVLPLASDKLLWNTAVNTATSLLVAGVFIVIFNLLADLSCDLLLTQALTNELIIFGVSGDKAEAITFGLIEMTRGCSKLAMIASPKEVAPLCAFVVTFGGCSVALQSVAYLAKCKISPAYYLLTKTTQSLIALGLCYLFCLLL